MKVGDKVKIIGGNFEFGCKNLIGYIGVISSIDNTKYNYGGKETYMIYVNVNNGLHCFNDYHLRLVPEL